MVGTIQRLGRNLRSRIRSVLSKPSDPKVELERVVAEVHAQHGSLVEQADAALTHQRDVERERGAAVTRLEKLGRLAAEATQLAEAAASAGDITTEAEQTAAAASFGSQADALAREVERLDHLSLQQAIASDAAKAGVQASAAALAQRLAERHEALDPSDRTDLEARLAEATELLSRPVGADTPTVEQVEARIEQRRRDSGDVPT